MTLSSFLSFFIWFSHLEWLMLCLDVSSYLGTFWYFYIVTNWHCDVFLNGIRCTNCLNIHIMKRLAAYDCDKWWCKWISLYSPNWNFIADEKRIFSRTLHPLKTLLSCIHHFPIFLFADKEQLSGISHLHFKHCWIMCGGRIYLSGTQHNLIKFILKTCPFTWASPNAHEWVSIGEYYGEITHRPLAGVNYLR